MSHAMTKGVTLLHLHDFVVERFGEPGLAKLRAALPERVARPLGMPNAAEWYPLTDYEQALQTLTDLFFEGDASKAAEFGMYNLEHSIRGVYRVIVWMLSPDVLLQKSARLWGTFLNEGKLESVLVSPGVIKLKVTGLHPTHASWCHGLRGSFLGSLKVCGAQDPKVAHDACVLQGAPECTFTATWSA